MIDHADEHDTHPTSIMVVAKRLGVSYESLRRRANQAEADGGVREGPSNTVCASCRSSNVRTVSLKKPSKSLKRQQVSSRGKSSPQQR